MIITRFAPSPTGYLHLGHAFAAHVAWRAAKDADGTCLLRIEDIDQGRSRKEFENALIEDLAWLGLTFSPQPLRQSDRFDAYQAALKDLKARGLLYPCFCTRRDIAQEIANADEAPHGPDGPIYPGICRGLSSTEIEARMAEGAPFALRLNMALAVETLGVLTWEDQDAGTVTATPAIFGDVVLARKDTPTSYHLAVTVDDAYQGITLVTRGKDLFVATHVHRMLQALLGLPTPTYRHHDLIADDVGKRLAKRDGARAIRELRAHGMTPTEVWAEIGLSRP